ncbi:MAG TPA: glycosyltransferase family 87 protein [Caulobacterales bacterium]|nr:glycosyltransferase family 87 protein [Caulobacterales bacterium]
MANVFRNFKLLLLALALLHLGLMARDAGQSLANANDLVFSDGISAVGGDFINMYAAGRLTLEGRIAEIYDPAAFMAFERTIMPAEIGTRFWAYPPTSLPLVAPLALLSFWPALILWSVLGLLLLGYGARRIGLDWLETALLVLSPAAISAVYYGQTGNAAAGLLLIALSAVRDRGALSPVAAALLTVKPQMGFLLPVLWLIRHQFRLIGATVCLVIALGALALWVAGPEAWRSYVGDTLSALNALERTGTGPFTLMIPSVFMAARLLTGDPALAQWVHWGFAAAVAAYVAWQFARTDSAERQNAILLVGTMLITPYIHIYDLAPAVCAAMLLMRRWTGTPSTLQLLICFVVLAAWALPALTLYGYSVGLPLGPPTLLLLLVALTLPLPRPSYDTLTLESSSK